MTLIKQFNNLTIQQYNSMAISKKITNYLDKNKYRYEIIEHRTTYTAWDISQTEKVNPREVAKALVMKVDRDCAIAVIPADRNLDKKKFLKLFNAQRKKAGEKCAKKADFAKEAWMKKNVPGKVGATPPFNKLLKMDIFADRLLLKNKKIYLGSGEYNMSIKINLSQYLKKEEPITGSFSRRK